jgi:hypothetical protein
MSALLEKGGRLPGEVELAEETQRGKGRRGYGGEIYAAACARACCKNSGSSSALGPQLAGTGTLSMRR